MEEVKKSLLLKDIAYNKIKEKILEEEFKPDRFLSERELIDLLQMSKTPIKSALDRLETEGFVTVSSKQGIAVKDLSIEQIIDIYHLRVAIETYNCEQIYKTITEEQLNLLRENLTLTKNSVEKRDVKEFAKNDHEFHFLIAKFAKNKEIQKILLNYNSHLLRITLRHLNRNPNRMEKFLQEHEEIYLQLEKKNRRCIDLMRNHLKDSIKLLFS
ncbi:GntR family transcriptional regulator [Neobacillus cucumis]|uniref:GntR family transcriptional regulator n=1 Tax=Neobacillus cucumis TaxID=1740721 RepID=A0A2N5HVP2_9BACI|nr:GntR family transcriptional regulator [Neobacillus cucumis]PLS09577.1 GntR family transcriptional regulator [Neobacillus cucumis]